MTNRIALFSFALAALCCIAGCNIVAPVAYVVGGRGNVPARLELDPERVHVFVIDDIGSNMPRRSYRRLIGESAEQFLIQRGKFPAEMLIPSNAALRITTTETWNSRLSLTEIGRQLGADVVIYLDVSGWTLSRDGGGISPAAQGRVKVIDAQNDQRLWPLDAQAYPLVVQLPRRSGQIPSQRAARQQIEEDLARNIGLHLAKIFYKHEIGTNEYIGE